MTALKLRHVALAALALVCAAAPAAPQNKIVIRFSSAAPPPDFLSKSMERFKEMVDKAAPDQFDIQLYPGGKLVRQGAEVPAIQRGNLEMSTMQAFEVVPQDLRRRIALRQTVDMVRVTMEFYEQVVPMLARSEEQATALTTGILRYSRDLAFEAASAYADAAWERAATADRSQAARGVRGMFLTVCLQTAAEGIRGCQARQRTAALKPTRGMLSTLQRSCSPASLGRLGDTELRSHGR